MTDVSISGVAPGELVGGRYKVSRLLGKGGMGAVYAAENTNSGRQVALKVIKPGVEQTPEQRRRFLREARAATAIQHPNVIEVYDVFEEDGGTLVMVMELLTGETLKEVRARRGALTLHEAAVLFLPMVEALHAAHKKGIVHRDLKPENVFLARGPGDVPVPKLLDFGIAKVTDPTTLSSETQGQETATGSLLGTPHYMSYEQAMSEKSIDQRSDIWSIGVMLFEVLTGRRPIVFENLGEMYTQFLTGTVPSIRQLIPELPADAASAIDGCLVKERAGRVDSLEPLIEMLARYADPEVAGGEAGGRVVEDVLPAERVSTIGASNTAHSVSDAEPPANGSAKVMLAAVVTAAAAIAGGYAWRSSVAVEPAEPPAAAISTPAAEPEAPTARPAAAAIDADPPATASATASASAASAPVRAPIAPRPPAGKLMPQPTASAASPPPPPPPGPRLPRIEEGNPYATVPAPSP